MKDFTGFTNEEILNELRCLRGTPIFNEHTKGLLLETERRLNRAVFTAGAPFKKNTKEQQGTRTTKRDFKRYLLNK